MDETKAVRVTYGQDWEAYNKAQINEVRLFDELLKDLVQNIEEPEYTFGRPKLDLRESVFCTIQKVYSQLSSRRAHSLYKNAVEKEQIDRAPHFNAVSKLLNSEELTPILHELIGISASPLACVESDFAVDSSGFRTSCFGQYAEQKYHFGRQHKWVKAHIVCGVRTNIVTSAKITAEYRPDTLEFCDLVDSTAKRFAIREVSADKAYSSKINVEKVFEVGGFPYLPFKKNASGKARGSMLWKKMFHYFQLNQDEFFVHYHKRSNVESVFGAMKKKFGETLKSKNLKAVENELLCKIIAYNITVLIHEMYELGITPQFTTSKVVSKYN